MSDGFDPPQGGFRAPRIPFDLRCVILAAAGVLVLTLVDRFLGQAFGVDSPAIRMVGGAFSHGVEGGVLAGMRWYQVLLTAIVFFAIWAFFGGALMRTAGLRLTRDEPFTLSEALAFGGKNWLSFLAAPLIVVLFAAFFTLCNMAAGLVLSLWGVGSTLLNFVLFPLVLLSSLLVTIAVLGGLVTLPLMWAGIAIEQNGALEAVSRAFSYIFARPLRFFFGYALILLLAWIVLLLGGHFERTVKDTLKLGVVRSSLDDLVSKGPAEVDRLKTSYENSEKVERQREGIANIRNIGDADWYDVIGFFWMWLLLSLFLLGFQGYAVYVLLGGTVSLYLQLRKEVDGADEKEIYPPLEEEGDAAGEPEPRWVGEEAAEPPADEPAEEAPLEADEETDEETEG